MEAKSTDGIDTLLIGIDACTNSILESFFQDGKLPHLESVFREGATSTLESQIPPWTASAWPSLYTGTNPGKHGIFDFITYDGYDWGVVNGSYVMEHSIWELLDYHDLTSVVVNVPMTHPVDEFDGALVPGFIAPEDPECHPPGLLEELRDAIGDYRVYPTPGGDEAVFEEYLECIEMRGEAFRYLADRFDPDFGFLQFQATDTVFHQYSGSEEQLIDAVYEAVDKQVGAVLEETDPNAVFVVSDHGIGEYDGYEFRINDFLREEGYVQTKRGGAGMPSWQVIRDDSLRQGDDDTMRDPGAVEKGVALASRIGLTTRRIGRVLEMVGLDELAKRHAPPGVVKVSNEQVDFPNSTAYMRSRVETGVRINLQGREPNGIVTPDEYETVRDELISLLGDVETPDGEPVFEDVARREEYFDGPHLDRAVDVATVPNDWNHFLSAQIRGELFGTPSESWNHKMEGIIAASGPAVDANADLTGAHLLDVAPTILSSLGVPPSDRMDGSPLPAVEPVAATHYPEYRTAVDHEADEGDVEQRLADLGYVE
jgi:predicted AlkP superfamily phosphohydrolase/phosphomutase